MSLIMCHDDAVQLEAKQTGILLFRLLLVYSIPGKMGCGASSDEVDDDLEDMVDDIRSAHVRYDQFKSFV